jgi:hypothetical protein
VRALHLLAAVFALAACDDDPPKPPHDAPERPPRPEAPAKAATSASSAAPAESARDADPSDADPSDADPSDADPSDADPSPSAAPSASASARDLDQRCPPAPGAAPPLKLVELRLTSAIENKRPTDEVTIIKPGDKVYAYLGIRNLTDDKRCVLVTFRVNGRQRSALTLDIGKAPSWRTWAYVKANDGDAAATIEIEVVDDQGHQHAHEKVLVEP